MLRQTIEVGPAKWTYGGQSFYTKSAGSIKIPQNTFAIDGEISGHVDDRFLGHSVDVSLVPDGRISTALAAVYWPHLTKKNGESLFASGAVQSLVASPLDGLAPHTVSDAAIVNMPDLILSTDKDMIGQIGFKGVYAYNKEPSAADSLYDIGTPAAFTEVAGFTQSAFKQGLYLATWGASGFADVESQNGWTVSFEMSTQETKISGALRDIRFKGLTVRVRGTPANIASSGLLDLALVPGAAGVTLGGSAYASAKALTISGGGVTVSLPKAMMLTAGMEFGSDVLRQGEVGFVAYRSFTSGVIDSTWCAITVA